MKDTWQDVLSCAVACARCKTTMTAEAPRILSVYDHLAICTACKAVEESRPDYADVSKEMIGQCMIDTEAMYGDPGGYCYHHFYPYRCKD
ncbi:MAG: hypothetical protein ABIL58_05575 [Pseudomonadota bacterium]